MTNIFRNEANGRYLKGLFFETTNADKSTVVYTLKDWDHEGFPSLYLLYMDANDPTEYSFAIKYLDGWEHWEMLCNCTWFKPFVARWRREIELKIKSAALLKIREDAGNPQSKSAHAANRFLLEKGWKDKEGPGKGRPKAQDIKDAADKLAKDHTRVQEDFERIIGKIA